MGLTLLCAGGAEAATVKLFVYRFVSDNRYEDSYVHASVWYQASPNERSTVRADLSGHRLTLTDATAELRPLKGCRQLDPHTITCDEPPDTTERSLLVMLGRGGDGAFSFGMVEPSSYLATTVTGGPADDRISGRGSGVLTAEGGPGDDAIIGGTGDDHITPGTGANAIDGGTGVDTVDFKESTGPVKASLKGGVAAAPNETETLRRVENISGSSYADRLTGGAGPNLLIGVGGNDTLIGLGGNDRLGGGGSPAVPRSKGPPEHNVLFGDAGDDELDPAQCANDELVPGTGTNTLDLQFSGSCVNGKPPLPGVLTRVFCSTNNDMLRYPNRFDLLVGCRRFRTPGWVGDEIAKAPPSHLTKDWSASYRVPCPYDERPCVETLRLRAHRKGRHAVLLGRGSLRRPRGGTRTVRARLTADGHAYLLRHPKALVEVVLAGHMWDGPFDDAYSVSLRPPVRPTHP
jgi:hypothetical protein